MNFSNRLTGLLYISSLPFFSFGLVLLFQISVSNLSASIFFIPLINSADQAPCVWDCKGRNLFSIVKLFLKLFFLFSHGAKPVLKKYKSLLIISSNQPPKHQPHLFPSSEAGCKSRKIINPIKLYHTIKSTFILTALIT
ncbi:hypothetical protein, partial [Pedobacter sp. AK017]|uniref:hypothetical protein n=1 Tax=Pedobacter sp. AK017 TaxID=2723073 RepID=UPI001C850B4D